MKHEPAIFEEHDPAAEAASLARARADVAAGRYHDHAVVSEWLGTWGSPDYLPFHQWLATRDG
jgi:predicted transcriptional regulator